MLLIRRCHGRIELNENVACFDIFPVMNVNGASKTDLERLYQLDTAVWDNLPARGGDNVNVTEARPDLAAGRWESSRRYLQDHMMRIFVARGSFAARSEWLYLF